MPNKDARRAAIEEFGRQVHELVRTTPMSNEEVAREIGIGYSTLCHWMRASGGRPNLTTRKKLREWAGHDVWISAQRAVRERQAPAEPAHEPAAAPEPTEQVELPLIDVEAQFTLKIPGGENEVTLLFSAGGGLALRQGADEVLFRSAAEYLAFSDAVRRIANGKYHG